MEQEANKHHFNLRPAMSHFPCNYMEQEDNKNHYIFPHYLSKSCNSSVHFHFQCTFVKKNTLEMHKYVPSNFLYSMYWYTIILKRYTMYVLAKFLPSERLLYHNGRIRTP